MAAQIPSALKDWSATAANNDPDGPDALTFWDENMRQMQATVRSETGTRDTIASAATCDLGTKDAGALDITGTTTITSFGTVSAGIRKSLRFTGVLTLTYNATSLILPTSASITTAAGDTAIAESLGVGNWLVSDYTRRTGQQVAATITFPDGTVSLPGMAFTSDLDTGAYRIGANNWALGSAGAKVLEVTAAGGVKIGSSGQFGVTAGGELDWTSANGAAISTLTVGQFNLQNGAGASMSMSGTTVSMTGTTGSVTADTISLTANAVGSRINLVATGSGSTSYLNLGSATLPSLRVAGNERHMVVVDAAGVPALTSGAGAGATIVGTDNCCKVTLGTGAGTTITLTFANSFTNAPMCFVNLNEAIAIYALGSATTVVITLASAPTSGKILDVWCIGRLAT